MAAWLWVRSTTTPMTLNLVVGGSSSTGGGGQRSDAEGTGKRNPWMLGSRKSQWCRICDSPSPWREQTLRAGFVLFLLHQRVNRVKSKDFKISTQNRPEDLAAVSPWMSFAWPVLPEAASSSGLPASPPHHRHAPCPAAPSPGSCLQPLLLCSVSSSLSGIIVWCHLNLSLLSIEDFQRHLLTASAQNSFPKDVPKHIHSCKISMELLGGKLGVPVVLGMLGKATPGVSSHSGTAQHQ